jgi:nucleoside-diphosphate-sugar epimerase
VSRDDQARHEAGAARLTAPSLVALTGATGFIGTTLLSRLAGAGWRVRALYRPRSGRVPAPSPGVEWLPGDLGDSDALEALVTGTEAVIHCAGTVRGARRSDFDRVNAEGAGRVARAAARLPRPPRLLLMSSLAARMPELSDYAGSKWRGECAVKAASDRMRWTVLRPPVVFGPGDRELLPLFRWIARGFVPVPAVAPGRFSLIHVDDLATAVLHWLAAETGYGLTFELDDGRPGGYDWDTVLTLAGHALREGRPLRRVRIPMPLLGLAASANLGAARILGYAPMLTPGKVREITHPDWLCDSQAFVLATGWRPAISLEIGLARAYGRHNAGTT